MHGLGEYPLWVKIRAGGYLPYRVLALGFSLLAHLGLILLLCFSVRMDGNVGFSDLKPSLIEVELNTGNANLSMRQVGGAIREPAHLTIVEHPVFSQGNQKVAVEKSIFPVSIPSKPYYFSAKDLTQKPLVARDITPDLVLVAPDVPVQAAILQILINEYGDVDQVIMKDSLLPAAAQKTVVDEFAKVKFHPGERNGIPVKSQLMIEIMLEHPDVEK